MLLLRTIYVTTHRTRHLYTFTVTLRFHVVLRCCSVVTFTARYVLAPIRYVRLRPPRLRLRGDPRTYVRLPRCVTVLRGYARLPTTSLPHRYTLRGSSAHRFRYVDSRLHTHTLISRTVSRLRCTIFYLRYHLPSFWDYTCLHARSHTFTITTLLRALRDTLPFCTRIRFATPLHAPPAVTPAFCTHTTAVHTRCLPALRSFTRSTVPTTRFTRFRLRLRYHVPHACGHTLDHAFVLISFSGACWLLPTHVPVTLHTWFTRTALLSSVRFSVRTFILDTFYLTITIPSPLPTLLDSPFGAGLLTYWLPRLRLTYYTWRAPAFLVLPLVRSGAGTHVSPRCLPLIPVITRYVDYGRSLLILPPRSRWLHCCSGGVSDVSTTTARYHTFIRCYL